MEFEVISDKGNYISNYCKHKNEAGERWCGNVPLGTVCIGKLKSDSSPPETPLVILAPVLCICEVMSCILTYQQRKLKKADIFSTDIFNTSFGFCSVLITYRSQLDPPELSLSLVKLFKHTPPWSWSCSGYQWHPQQEVSKAMHYIFIATISKTFVFTAIKVLVAAWSCPVGE